MARILLIKLRALGDTVILSSAVQSATELFPNSKVDLLVPQPWASLFENFPRVDKVFAIALPKSRLLRAFHYVKLIWPLRKRRYETVILFHAGRASALLTAFLGRVRRAIHFHGVSPRFVPRSVAIPDQGKLKPIIERDLDALRALGLTVSGRPMPRVFLNEAETAWAENWLMERNLASPLLALGLGASRATKSWGLDRFVELACKWVEEDRGCVLVTVGPNDSLLETEFLTLLESQTKERGFEEALRKRVCVVSALDLRSLAALYSVCSVMVGNDSGPRHLAAAVGTPTVTLFGPEEPYEWHPYPQDRHPYFFIEGLACRKNEGLPTLSGVKTRWCGIAECNEYGHQCMTKIQVQQVLERCRRLLK